MNSYSNLAKKAVETFIKEKKVISPPDNLPKDFFEKRAGVFVTIEKAGQLRGCIGTYLPTRVSIAEEIIQNAIAAATEDYRFGAIKKEDLSFLSYTVYILSYPEPVKNVNELDPKKFGIIVKTNPFVYPNQDMVFNGKAVPKTGLLLPDLEGVDNVEKQIAIACHKAEINPNEEKIFVYKFTVEKYQ
jgi:uncharacterized protein (TIGR00296 family)